jgi:transaldolase
MTARTLAFQVPGPSSDAAGQIRQFCLDAAANNPAATLDAPPHNAVWKRFVEAGTELWLDTGDIDAIRPRWTREYTALTTNNTLLNKEIQKGIYDGLVPEAANLIREVLPGASEHQVVLEIAFLLNAVHGLKLVRAFDADVSVELHTDVSNDVDASVRFGRRFHAIEPDRFIVKIPLTPAGLVAARQLHEDGIRVNFTLGFSARQNLLISHVARPNWCNVFMGRINSLIADGGMGSGDGAGEKATLASQRVLRQLRDAGGPSVKQIGASVRSGEQVLALAGVDTLTIPIAAADAALASGPALGTIVDRTGEDPTADASAECSVFWDVSNSFRTACEELGALSPDALTPEAVVETLQKHGEGDLFPAYSAEDETTIAADGKIPKVPTWKDRVAKREASWDGLLSAAALASFATDQAGFDDRVRGLV